MKPSWMTLVALLLAPAGVIRAQSNDSKVTYIAAANLKAAFAKGMPVVEVGDYKVHASRRAGPGMAEVHTRDTDIAYMLQGSATLVTGGRAINLKSIGPEELRGSGIEGGETRELVPGDCPRARSGRRAFPLVLDPGHSRAPEQNTAGLAGLRYRGAHPHPSGRRGSGRDRGGSIPKRFPARSNLLAPFPTAARPGRVPSASNSWFGRHPPPAAWLLLHPRCLPARAFRFLNVESRMSPWVERFRGWANL